MSNEQYNSELTGKNKNTARMEQRSLVSEIKALSLACFHAAEEEYIDLQTTATALQGISRLAEIAESLDTV